MTGSQGEQPIEPRLYVAAATHESQIETEIYNPFRLSLNTMGTQVQDFSPRLPGVRYRGIYRTTRSRLGPTELPVLSFFYADPQAGEMATDTQERIIISLDPTDEPPTQVLVGWLLGNYDQAAHKITPQPLQGELLRPEPFVIAQIVVRNYSDHAH